MQRSINKPPTEDKDDVTVVADLSQVPQLFQGCYFVTSTYEHAVRERIHGLLESLGATVLPFYSQRCTHLISRFQLGDEYNKAKHDNKVTATVAWLNACVRSKTSVPQSESPDYFPARITASNISSTGGIPSMKSLIVSVSGFVGSERDELINLVRATGAQYTGDLTRANTHLICKEATGMKWKKAPEWRITTINKDWLYHCIKYWNKQNETGYPVPPAKTPEAGTSKTSGQLAAKKERDAANGSASKTATAPQVAADAKTTAGKSAASSSTEPDVKPPIVRKRKPTPAAGAATKGEKDGAPQSKRKKTSAASASDATADPDMSALMEAGGFDAPHRKMTRGAKKKEQAAIQHRIQIQARQQMQQLLQSQGKTGISPELIDPSILASALVKTTGLLYDHRMCLHEGPQNHPERPSRVTVLWKLLQQHNLVSRCEVMLSREASYEELLLVHTKKHVDALAYTAKLDAMTLGESQTQSQSQTQGDDTQQIDGATSNEEHPKLRMTSDIYLNKHTYEAAKLAAGGVTLMCEKVITGELKNGLAIVRPPGHHAERDRAMGFCLFNNVAVAAQSMRSHYNVKKVLIVDFDVHHGNGTQHIFENDPNVLYFSIHRFDGGNYFPGTGDFDECGKGKGEGYTVNVPWPPARKREHRYGDADYLAVFHHILMPIATEFAPNLVIVSAGFDAVDGDPLGRLNVTTTGYAHMTAMLKTLAGGKIVMALEGGYNLEETAECAMACLKVLLNDDPPVLAPPYSPSKRALEIINVVMGIQSRYWKCFDTLGYYESDDSSDSDSSSSSGSSSSDSSDSSSDSSSSDSETDEKENQLEAAKPDQNAVPEQPPASPRVPVASETSTVVPKTLLTNQESTASITVTESATSQPINGPTPTTSTVPPTTADSNAPSTTSSTENASVLSVVEVQPAVEAPKLSPTISTVTKTTVTTATDAEMQDAPSLSDMIENNEQPTAAASTEPPPNAEIIETGPSIFVENPPPGSKHHHHHHHHKEKDSTDASMAEASSEGAACAQDAKAEDESADTNGKEKKKSSKDKSKSKKHDEKRKKKKEKRKKEKKEKKKQKKEKKEKKSKEDNETAEDKPSTSTASAETTSKRPRTEKEAKKKSKTSKRRKTEKEPNTEQEPGNEPSIETKSSDSSASSSEDDPESPSSENDISSGDEYNASQQTTRKRGKRTSSDAVWTKGKSKKKQTTGAAASPSPTAVAAAAASKKLSSPVPVVTTTAAGTSMRSAAKKAASNITAASTAGSRRKSISKGSSKKSPSSQEQSSPTLETPTSTATAAAVQQPSEPQAENTAPTAAQSENSASEQPAQSSEATKLTPLVVPSVIQDVSALSRTPTSTSPAIVVPYSALGSASPTASSAQQQFLPSVVVKPSAASPVAAQAGSGSPGPTGSATAPMALMQVVTRTPKGNKTMYVQVPTNSPLYAQMQQQQQQQLQQQQQPASPYAGRPIILQARSLAAPPQSPTTTSTPASAATTPGTTPAPAATTPETTTPGVTSPAPATPSPAVATTTAAPPTTSANTPPTQEPNAEATEQNVSTEPEY